MASLDAATTATAPAGVNTERRRADRTPRDVFPEPIPAEVLDEPGAGLAAIGGPGLAARRLGMRLGPTSGERLSLASSEMGAVESGTQTTDGTLLAGNETIPSGDQRSRRAMRRGTCPSCLRSSSGRERIRAHSPAWFHWRQPGREMFTGFGGKKRLTLGEGEYDA